MSKRDVIKSILSEKLSIETDARRVYGFKVPAELNKYQIKKLVEDKYNVKVLSVNTLNESKRQKRYGRFVATVAGVKKAYVKLEDGQKIEFFKGV